MTQAALNDNVRTATFERVACYTVGIVMKGGSAVGTGTCRMERGYH